jgi:tryptophan synthase beta chain
MVHAFQEVIGRETQEQLSEIGVEPTALVTCVGGGSNAIGFFGPYLESDGPRLVGVEAGGRSDTLGDHAARMSGAGKIGIVQGYKSLFLLDEDGQVAPTHSISAGLDYPGIGPELAAAGTARRVEFRTARDDEALEALKLFARDEGIAFALESAHGAAEALKLAATMSPNESVVVNMSGRGDKDLFITAREIQPEAWRAFLSQEAER